MSWGEIIVSQCIILFMKPTAVIYLCKKMLLLYFDVYLAKSFSLTSLNPDIGQEIVVIFCWSAQVGIPSSNISRVYKQNSHSDHKDLFREPFESGQFQRK